MRVVYIDDEEYARENFKFVCSKIDIISSVECFGGYLELIGHLMGNVVDVVFADISMPGVDGIGLMNHIRGVNDKVPVVYVTGHDEYAIAAFDVGASGYILKPYTQAKIEKVLSRLHLTESRSLKVKTIEIKTFGRFDIFVNGNAVHFSNKKSKELLALLVDRLGGVVTMEQAIDLLWEDRPFDDKTKNLYRIALKNLRDTLKFAGCIDILVETRGQRNIDFTNIKCDYFDYVHNGNKADFAGEYMSDYSWGEYTLAKLYDF